MKLIPNKSKPCRSSPYEPEIEVSFSNASSHIKNTNPVMQFGQQLILHLPWHQDPTFDHFYPGPNQFLFHYLKQFVTHQADWFVYLWGERGVGRSHLLQACCHAVLKQERRALYLRLDEAGSDPVAPAILDQLEAYDLIAIDDVDRKIGHWHWEEALFHFFNRLYQKGSCLIVAGRQPPSQMPYCLLDLRSRLAGGINFEVLALQDEEKLLALQQCAHLRGLELSDEVGQYLLRHYPRNMSDLMSILEKLDRASLASQRRLTIPFVKSYCPNS